MSNSLMDSFWFRRRDNNALPRRVFILLIVSCLINLRCGSLVKAEKNENSDQQPAVCFVVRTYWGHGDKHGGELRALLESLRAQDNPNWEAILVVVDKTPFPEAYDVIQSLNESRAWVFAEWIGDEFTPKEEGQWVDGYHGALYNVTDNAIRLCNPSTQWVVATNGDNLYGRGFVSKILEVARDETDIVSFDFYSRYQKPTMPSCDRFTLAFNKGRNCKRNTLKWCQTDLGSVAIRRKKFIDEERYFGMLDNEGYGLDESHNDGLLFGELLEDGWNVVKIEGECLFVHNPSIQSCAWRGWVWDDSNITWTGGGECIDPHDAHERVKADPLLEMVQIEVSHAENYRDQFLNANESLSNVSCIRRVDYISGDVWGDTCNWFPKGCTDEEDFDMYEKGVRLFRTDPSVVHTEL